MLEVIVEGPPPAFTVTAASPFVPFHTAVSHCLFTFIDLSLPFPVLSLPSTLPFLDLPLRPSQVSEPSRQLRDFVSSCLKKEPEGRLTAAGCLHHEFLLNSADAAAARSESTAFCPFCLPALSILSTLSTCLVYFVYRTLSTCLV